MINPGSQLRHVMEQANLQLESIHESQAALRLKPGSWSMKEILGHLIDSASNNHKRFVVAKLVHHLEFDGYAQEDWVRVQRYEDRAWADLVDLWVALNLHIAHTLEATTDEVLDLQREHHNLETIAWKTLPANEPATLRYFAEDYKLHLEHHLRQIQAILDHHFASQ